MPRPLAQQIVVITGASSGIGRQTALTFAKAGATCVVAARGGEALDAVAQEIERLGGRALPVVTDVGDWLAVEALARAAVDHFGRIDTWVNNAAISVYATAEELSVEEVDRVVRVNLLGQIYGCKAALPAFRRQGTGTIINVASVLAERSVPLQSAYCASKHGIKGFTESLRLELQRDPGGVAVCLVLPSSINTPLFAHARSRLGKQPAPIPPVYEPSTVAEAIAALAVHPRRQVVVGGAGKLVTLLERLSPALLDWYMARGNRGFHSQLSDRADDGSDNLFQPWPGAGRTTGEAGEQTRSSSLYTRYLELHPARKNGLLAAGVLASLLLVARLGR